MKRLLQPQSVEHDGGSIPDSHLTDNAFFHCFARSGEHDLHFRIGIAAMAIAFTAVICSNDKESILQEPQLRVGIIKLADPPVLLGYLFQVSFVP